jgi:hypothetical protein
MLSENLSVKSSDLVMTQATKIINWLKRHPAIYDCVRHQLYSRFRSFNRREIFLDAYRHNIWDEETTASGIGSSLKATETLRAALPKILMELKVKSLLDIPCGDFHWMNYVPLEIERYIGADLVKDLIEHNVRLYSDRGIFFCMDLLSDRLPKVDAIFCRDCLVHLSLRDVRRAIKNIKAAKPNYVMTTTFPGCARNLDTVAPYWRPLNLEIRPFNFPKPIFIAKDFCDNQRNDQGKYLGVWSADEIP